MVRNRGGSESVRCRWGAVPGIGAMALLLGLVVGCDVSYPSTEWGDSTYDHALLSGGFQLLGTHAGAPCTACHAASNYEPRFQADDGNDCQACHREAYEAQHGGTGYPMDCALCHTPTVWADGSFDHGSSSGGFELLTVHASLPCAACHASDTFEPLFDPSAADDCGACHLADFPARHAQRGIPPDCGLCHTPTAWGDGFFDHLAISGSFELLGIHIAAPCTACHDSGTFEPVFNPADANDCVVCHLSRYESAHEGTGYPTTCVSCHTPTFWKAGMFNHAGISGGFELLGAHEALPCYACHDAETFEPLFDPQDADDCVACHRDDYEGQHGGTGYPLTCTSCHTPTAWSGGSFDHVVVSGGFELLGVHEEVACVGCHAPEDFAPLFDPSDETDCLACHQEDYDGEHGGTGYPTDCSACHTPTLWSDGTFDHEVASGGFELLGIHAGKPCVSCHDPDTFQPIFNPAGETDCLSCHQAQYEAQHGADGYPTTCLSCHTPTDWKDEDFDHDRDYFPIFTGEHAPRWSTCATCHTDRDDFSNFTCFLCHAHDQVPMDKKHEDEDGYAYVPSACITCHPAGEVVD